MQRAWSRNWVYWAAVAALTFDAWATWSVSLPVWYSLITSPEQTLQMMKGLPLSHSAFSVIKVVTGLTGAASLAALLARSLAVRRVYGVHFVLSCTATLLLAGNRLAGVSGAPGEVMIILVALAVMLTLLGLVGWAILYLTSARNSERPE